MSYYLPFWSLLCSVSMSIFLIWIGGFKCSCTCFDQMKLDLTRWRFWRAAICFTPLLRWRMIPSSSFCFSSWAAHCCVLVLNMISSASSLYNNQWLIPTVYTNPHGILKMKPTVSYANLLVWIVECWHPDENMVLSLRLGNLGLQSTFPQGLQSCSRWPAWTYQITIFQDQSLAIFHGRCRIWHLWIFPIIAFQVQSHRIYQIWHTWISSTFRITNSAVKFHHNSTCLLC